jgi:hypothetical protein
MDLIKENENAPNINKLDQIASSAKESIGTDAMAPGQKVKGKRGRPSKEEQAKKAKMQKDSVLGPKPTFDPSTAAQVNQSVISSKEIGRPIAQFISSTAISYVEDPRAGMTPDELENLSMALGLVMDKYMPDLLNKYGPEAMLCICLGQYGIRVMAMKKYLDAEKKSQAQKVMTPENPKPVQTEGGESFSAPSVKVEPDKYAS